MWSRFFGLTLVALMTVACGQGGSTSPSAPPVALPRALNVISAPCHRYIPVPVSIVVLIGPPLTVGLVIRS